MSGKKSDHVEEMALANILRTDRHQHRLLPEDTAGARSISVLARAYQDGGGRGPAGWCRSSGQAAGVLPGLPGRIHGRLRVGAGIVDHPAGQRRRPRRTRHRAEPRTGRSCRRPGWRQRRGHGRQRRISSLAAQIVTALRTPQLRQDPVVEQAMRVETLALLGVLDAVCDSVDRLASALGQAFGQRPDSQVITSFPGLADISGAIVLAEIGDDRDRFRRRPGTAGLRRLRPGHPSLGEVADRDPAANEEQPARRRRILVGIHRSRSALAGPGALPASP